MTSTIAEISKACDTGRTNCALEERIDESYDLKKAKYQDIADLCSDRVWKSWVFPVKI